MATIFLLDDERSFADNRNAIVARTVEDAIKKANELTVIDELWLDYILTYGDTLPFLHYLTSRYLKGNPVEVRRLIFHSSASIVKPLIDIVAAKAGITVVEFPTVRVTHTTIGE